MAPVGLGSAGSQARGCSGLTTSGRSPCVRWIAEKRAPARRSATEARTNRTIRAWRVTFSSMAASRALASSAAAFPRDRSQSPMTRDLAPSSSNLLGSTAMSEQAMDPANAARAGTSHQLVTSSFATKSRAPVAAPRTIAARLSSLSKDERWESWRWRSSSLSRSQVGSWFSSGPSSGGSSLPSDSRGVYGDGVDPRHLGTLPPAADM